MCLEQDLGRDKVEEREIWNEEEEGAEDEDEVVSMFEDLHLGNLRKTSWNI